MMFIDDDRGVQPIIGAIFVFALIILLLGTLQTFAVPNQTEEIEFKHSQEVQADLTDLEAAISQTASVGNELTTRVSIGTQYPSRFILLNPPAATGSLRTETSGNLTLANVEAANSEETGDFLNGTDHNYTTNRVTYDPQYNRYSEAPETVVTTGIVYDRYDDRTIAETEDIVDGKRINLVVLDGNLSETGLSTRVQTEPLSAPTETVAVTNETGQNVNITIATQLNASTWEDILEEDLVSNGGFVADVVDAPGDRVTIVMQQGETYKLRMAKVGVGSGATDPEPAYMTDVQGNGSGVAESGRQELVVQVRDKYNNPVVGEEVTFGIEDFDDDAEDGELLDGPNEGTAVVRTDENGRATVTYQAPAQVDGSPQNIDVNATYEAFAATPDGEPDEVEFQIRVINGSQVNKATPLFNPANGVVVTDAEIAEYDCGTGMGQSKKCRVDVTFEVANSTTDETVEEARYLFYSEDEQGSVGVESHARLYIDTDGNPYPSGDEYPISEDYEDAGYTIAGTGDTTIPFEFRDDSGDPGVVQPGDFFVISFITDGERQTYFVAPEDDN